MAGGNTNGGSRRVSGSIATGLVGGVEVRMRAESSQEITLPSDSCPCLDYTSNSLS